MVFKNRSTYVAFVAASQVEKARIGLLKVRHRLAVFLR